MATRKRIGYGPFDWNDLRNSKVWLQNEFLKSIENLEPTQHKKPLSDLAKQPLEQYVKFIEKKGRSTSSRQRRVFEQEDLEPGRLSFFSLLDTDAPLRESIWAWGETYHLNSNWCYDIALLTLQHWYKFKSTTRKQFEPLPFYGNPIYLSFASLVMAHRLASMPYDSLSKEQKAIVDDFSEGDKQFLAFFNERERVFLSSYPHDPHIMDGEFFSARVEDLIAMALPPVNTALPVLNLLNRNDLEDLRNVLRKRAKMFLKRLNEYAKRNSIKSREVRVDVSKRLEWAVRYQVFDERFYSIGSKPHIAQAEKKTAYASVRKEALHILELIDLQPRKSPKGRSPIL
jgi:hypothetical protein